MTFPVVRFIAAGGTICLYSPDRLDLTSYDTAGKSLTADELLGRVSELRTFIRPESVPFQQQLSSSVGPLEWLALNEAVHRAVDGAAGVVVAHGTNTLEETAYFLNLALVTQTTVVVVGAMRPPSALGSDAELNLLNAFRVAASHETNGMGVLVLMNGEIHAARDVTKAGTHQLEAFESRLLGPLGFTEPDGKVVVHRRPTHPHTANTPFDVRKQTTLPRVDVVQSYAGQDGTMIDAAVNAGTRGIIISGTGAGKWTPLEEIALARALGAGIHVVACSRTGSGRVPPTAELALKGILAGEDLSPWKARVLLMLGLARTNDTVDLQQFFSVY
jgi:L-asparaginase